MSDLPERIVVDQHGHYWRDFGDYWSMCPVSEENVDTEVVATYIRAGAAPRAEGLKREAAAATPSLDWTQDWNGRSNSSPLFKALIEDVARLIRQDAHLLLQGDADSVARLIMAQLAHKHGLAPVAALDALDVSCHRCEGRGWVDNSHDQADPRARPICSCCAGTGKERPGGTDG